MNDLTNMDDPLEVDTDDFEAVIETIIQEINNQRTIYLLSPSFNLESNFDKDCIDRSWV